MVGLGAGTVLASLSGAGLTGLGDGVVFSGGVVALLAEWVDAAGAVGAAGALALGLSLPGSDTRPETDLPGVGAGE